MDSSHVNMKYSLLCSGSKGNCLVIDTKETTIVLDCGSTKRYLNESFKTIDLEMERIDALLLTHEHSDHIAQIKMFKEKPIFSPFVLPQIEVTHQVNPYQPFVIGSLTIMAIPLSHDTDITMGYIFDDGDEKLVYITDTGYVRTHDFQFISGADYYIMESNHDPEMLMKTTRPYYTKQRILSDSGHLSNEDSALILNQIISIQTKEIILAHVSEQANTPELVYKVMHQTLVNYLEQVRIKVAGQFEVVRGGTL